MLLSQPTTLLVVTRDRVIRAEFASASAAAPSMLAVRERPETDDPIVAVTAALGHERRALGKVFVLSADVWIRTLEMPAANAAAMSAEELRHALAFEAEPLSGMAPAETTTAAVTLQDVKGTRSLWVTQVGTHTLGEIDEVVRGARGKLAGLLHPAGVPLALKPGSDGAPWSRVEFWSDIAVRLVGEKGKPTEGRIDNARTANRPAIVAEWEQKGTSGGVEVWFPEFRPAPDAEWLTAADDEALARWLTQWNRALAARHPTVPLIAAPKRPLTSQQRTSISLALAGVALLGCIAHNYWAQQSIDTITAEQARIEAPGKELASLQQAKTAAEKKIKELETANAARKTEVEQAEHTLDAHRRRLGLLLERLANDSSGQWVLRSIEGNPREMQLHGVTMHPEHINHMAATMAVDLAKLGWAIDPPEQQARNLRDDGGPWNFSLRLRDMSVPKGEVVDAPPNASNIVRTPGK
jgi:hypothetical protein